MDGPGVGAMPKHDELTNTTLGGPFGCLASFVCFWAVFAIGWMAFIYDARSGLLYSIDTLISVVVAVPAGLLIRQAVNSIARKVRARG
jgi:hypothetical protein